MSHDEEPAEDGPGPAAHEDTGLELAKTIAKSIAGAAQSAPRKKRRSPSRQASKGRTAPKASGAHPDERDPQLLDVTLGRLVDDHGWTLDLKVHSVFGRWTEIVGAEVAQHCAPTAYADGRLVVRTDSTAWATQLRLLAPTLVRRLNEELGHGTVTVIEVLGPNLPTWKNGYYRTSGGRGPRDTYG